MMLGEDLSGLATMYQVKFQIVSPFLKSGLSVGQSVTVFANGFAYLLIPNTISILAHQFDVLQYFEFLYHIERKGLDHGYEGCTVVP